MEILTILKVGGKARVEVQEPMKLSVKERLSSTVSVEAVAAAMQIVLVEGEAEIYY